MKVSASVTPSGVNTTGMPSGTEVLAEPAVAGVDRGQREAGDRRRHRERQVDHRVDDPAARERIAHQHPGDEQPEDGVDRGRGEATAPKVSR